MQLKESILSALRSVAGNKMRSVLTMLGIIIGISAVIMITSIGQGFQASVTEQFNQLGATSLQISVKYDDQLLSSDLLTMRDIDVLMTHPEVSSVAPLFQTSGRVKLKNPAQSSRCYFFGSTEAYKNVQSLDLRYGRFLTAPDVTSSSKVVIIDETLSKKIFGRANSVGETIKSSFWFGEAELTVVGVYRNADFGTAMFEMPTMAYMPITTIMKMHNTEYVDNIFVNVKDLENIDRTALEISKILSLSHNNTNKYNVQNLMKQMDTVNSVLGNITAFVALVAFISLVVGGIGVMNIMLVTVTERTREIGIRKSLGATDGNIKFQFLVEAMILTAIGGIIGIALGLAGGFALGNAIKIQPYVHIPYMLLTVGISCAIGIVFGVYPASKAAKLDPIEALRYE